MKKYLIGLLAIILCLTVVGCGKEKEEEKEKDEIVVGGWEVVLTDKEVSMSEEELEIFNKAKENYAELKLEPVVLLGSQLVAGTNYMYLAKGYKDDESNKEYKIVVVYNDLQGNASVTSVNDFDLTKYAGQELPKKYAKGVGTWEVRGTGKPGMLEDEELQNSFEAASEKIETLIFNPICTLGKQLVAGTNYAVLTYARGIEDQDTSIYVATLYVDLQGNAEITYLAYLNLADYNK